MYNLHVEKKDKKTNKPTTCVQKMANSFCSSRKVYNLQTKTSTKHFTDHSLVFRQAEKKNITSHHIFKNLDFKTSKKKRKKKKRRAVIKKKLKPHVAVGLF